MAHFEPVSSIPRRFTTSLPSSLYLVYSNDRRNEDDTFGWQLFHDRQRNLIYYLHNYTGEVRWPRPETVGFVMHGLKPLPASASINTRTDSIVNPDIWSPFYPHVVMLPSGLVRVHPGPDSKTKGITEMWCGYNRFPLTSVIVDGALSEQHRTNKIDRMAMLESTEPRILPPTWEELRSGSPFLSPYPVAILKSDDTEDKPKAAPSLLHRLDERFHTPVVDGLHSFSHGDLGRVHGSMDWTTGTSYKTTKESCVFKQQPACSKGVSVPNTERKEHNRKGYLLRQARKMMRENGANTTVATSISRMSKQRKDQETTATKLERPLNSDQKNGINDGDCDTLLSSHC
ncbi:unnamed protein product [Peronospora farinosa]|uniref:WW domain-containing protein n=1 Tax=Peronospora farinosa TaxID=134698 RepID=A0AAV0SVS0_9STRA|nr:unnamed protein product [Peronospora farinosa]CAI5706554.1 unnamed protein product [Peronospora farinosa]